MAHEFRAWVDTDADITTILNTLNSEGFRDYVILPERNQKPQEREYIDGIKHIYAHYHINENVNLNDFYKSVETENIQQYVNWGVLKYRQSVAEYRHGPQSRYGDYYRNNLDTGLRTDPRIQKTDHLKIRLSNVDYRINGTDYTSDYQTINFEGHKTTKKKVRIVGTSNGVELIEGDTSKDPTAPSEPKDSVTFAIVTLYPSEIDGIDTKTQAEQYDTTEWQTEYEIGNVPKEFL